MAQTLFTIAIHHYVWNLRANRIFKSIAQNSIVERPLFKLFACESGRFAKRYDAGNVFSAGTSLALLMSADVLSVKSHTSPDVKRAHTFWRIQLVSRDCQQIAAKFLDIQTQSSSSLDGIGMKPEMSLPRSSPFTNERTDFSNWLDRADFIVRQHHCNEDCIGTKRCGDVFNSHDSISVNRQPRNFPASFFQFRTNTSDRWMLDRRGDDVLSMHGRGFTNTSNGEIV